LIIVESMIYYYAVLLGFIFVKAFSENTTAEFATNSSILLSLTEAENISEQVEAFSSNHSSDADDVAVEMAKHCPEVRCYGRNCAIVREFNACPVCACPIGSPARGCDRMPKYMYDELFKNGCQNLANPTAPRYPAVTVFRWYRYTNHLDGTDECRIYIYPYCRDYELNVWPSPKTREECYDYCYKTGMP
ncbi:hypothetical protein T02_13002, partial [Trichinella nativa]